MNQKDLELYIKEVNKVPFMKQDELLRVHPGVKQLTSTIDDFVYSHSKEEQKQLELLDPTIQKYPFYEKIIKQFKDMPFWKDGQVETYFHSRNLIVTGNINLVIYCAKEYRRLNLDSIQNGTMGLIRAVNTYNPEISKFTTYAYNLIKKTLLRNPKSPHFKIPPSCKTPNNIF